MLLPLKASPPSCGDWRSNTYFICHFSCEELSSMYKVLISLLMQESTPLFSNLCPEDYTQQTSLKSHIRVLLMTGVFGETHMFCVVFLRIMVYLLLQHWEFCLLPQGLSPLCMPAAHLLPVFSGTGECRSSCFYSACEKFWN